MQVKTWRTGLLAIGASLIAVIAQAATIDFSDVGLAPDSYYNGSPGGSPPDGTYGGPFTSGDVTFPNQYIVSTFFGNTYTTVVDWAASNKVVAPPVTGSYGTNFQPQYQFSVPNGNTGNYGAAFLDVFGSPPLPYLELPAGMKPTSLQVNNLTYVYLSLRDGDGFAKKFGGSSGDDEDFFTLTIQGLTSSDVSTGSVSFNLADFIGSNTTIVDNWQTIDLTPLGNASKLAFSMASSDSDLTLGMNTPAAFAMDNLVVTPVPEPSTWLIISGAVAMAIVRTQRRRVS